jgi:hypothetical protein
MLMVFLKTILGMTFLITGFGIAYSYLSNMDNGSSPLLLIPSLCIVILGIFMLMRAGKSDETVILKPKKSAEDQLGNTGIKKATLIRRNNAISEEWARSVEKRDKMKLLKIAASAEEKTFERGY